eukprot:15346700-Ditylum_brightwellii.AAC.1
MLSIFGWDHGGLLSTMGLSEKGLLSFLVFAMMICEIGVVDARKTEGLRKQAEADGAVAALDKNRDDSRVSSLFDEDHEE